MIEKLAYIFIGAVAIIGVALLFAPTAVQNLSGQNVQIWSGGGVGTSTTCGMTATLAVTSSSWSEYLRISNNSTYTVSVFPDNSVASTSAVGNNQGITLLPVGLTTSTGDRSYVEFGSCATCVPFIGGVNCISTQTSGISVFRR